MRKGTKTKVALHGPKNNINSFQPELSDHGWSLGGGGLKVIVYYSTVKGSLKNYVILFSYTFDPSPPLPPCVFPMGVVFSTDPPPSPCGFVIDVVFFLFSFCGFLMVPNVKVVY